LDNFLSRKHADTLVGFPNKDFERTVLQESIPESGASARTQLFQAYRFEALF